MANKSDRKTIIEACGNVVKLASGIGTWKIANWVLDAVMPASVKLPIRVCVRTAMWVLTGMVQEKSDDYIDRSANDISEAIEKGIESVESMTKQEEESSDPAKEAANHAVKRNNYIQKRKEKKEDSGTANDLNHIENGIHVEAVENNVSDFSFDIPKTTVEDCGLVVEFRVNNKMHADTLKYMLQTFIGIDSSSTKEEVDSIKSGINYQKNSPYYVQVPKSLAEKYDLIRVVKGGES